MNAETRELYERIRKTQRDMRRLDAFMIFFTIVIAAFSVGMMIWAVKNGDVVTAAVSGYLIAQAQGMFNVLRRKRKR